MTRSTRNRMLLMAYNRGRQACALGLTLAACPYPDHVQFRTAWERGFQETRRKERRRFASTMKELASLTAPARRPEDR